MLTSFCILIIGFAAIAIDYAFVKPREDKQLFKLYRLRDELALQAMKNPKIQDEEEYKCLNRIICREIVLLRDNIPIFDIISNYKKMSEEDMQWCDEIIDKIQNDSKYNDIYKKSHDIFDKQFDKHMKYFGTLVVNPIAQILKLIINLINRENASAKEIRDKKRNVYKIKETIENPPINFKQLARY
jgi:hypothetical protein